MNTKMKTTIVILLVIVGFFAIKTGIEKHERNECIEWGLQATNSAIRNGYYITKWQYDQCAHHGMMFYDIPIK